MNKDFAQKSISKCVKWWINKYIYHFYEFV